MADITREIKNHLTSRVDGNLCIIEIDTTPSTKTADYTVLCTDDTMLGDATGGSFSFYLPSAVDVPSLNYLIKKIDSSANTVSIIPSGVETIDGNSSIVLSIQYDYLSIISDGTNWVINGQIPTLSEVLSIGSNGGGKTITNATWNGSVVTLAYGGTNANLVASNGGIFYSTATAGAILAGTVTAGKMLRSGASSAPSWSANTFPDSTTINQILYATAANVINSSANFVTDGTTMSLGTSTLTAGMVFDGVGSANSGQRIRITNNTSGTVAYSSFDAVSSTAVTTQFGTLSNGYTTSGILVANRGFITTTSTSGLSIAATGAGSSIYFAVAGTTQAMQLDSNGTLGVGVSPTSTQYVIQAQGSSNAGRRIIIANATSGTAAYASLDAISSTSVLLQSGVLSNGYTTNGVLIANRTFILASGSSTGIAICTTDNQPLVIALNGTAELYRFMPTGNFKVGGTATRATTEGTNQVVIFNGTAPVGTLTNGCSFYSTAGEMRVMDAAGNATLLSPHEKGTNYWVYDSLDTTTGKRLKIDMEQFMKWLNKKHGLNFVHEYLSQ